MGHRRTTGSQRCGRGRYVDKQRTSGKVPLEKTLSDESQYNSDRVKGQGFDSHQQTGLTAGTITDDDKFAANFSHGGLATGRRGWVKS